jgi:hypothetical protein
MLAKLFIHIRRDLCVIRTTRKATFLQGGTSGKSAYQDKTAD